MSDRHVYRLVVTLPEGADEPGWRPVNWQTICEARGWHEEAFAWPRRKVYLSKSGALARAKLLREYGATVEVERSLALQWPSEVAALQALREVEDFAAGMFAGVVTGEFPAIPGQGRMVVEDGVTMLVFDEPETAAGA